VSPRLGSEKEREKSDFNFTGGGRKNLCLHLPCRRLVSGEGKRRGGREEVVIFVKERHLTACPHCLQRKGLYLNGIGESVGKKRGGGG